MVIEPLREAAVNWAGREGVEKKHRLCGPSLGNRKNIPRLAFGTSSEIELQLCMIQRRASPEDFERGSRRTVAT